MTRDKAAAVIASGLVALAVCAAPVGVSEAAPSGSEGEGAEEVRPTDAWSETHAWSARSERLLDDALRAMIMTRDDLSFRTDYADAPDSFRLSVVDSLLVSPLDTELFVLDLAGELVSLNSVYGRVGTCLRELDLEVAGTAVSGARSQEADVASNGRSAAGAPWRGLDDILGPGDRPRKWRDLEDILGQGDPPLILLSAIREAGALIDRAFAQLSDEERAFVAENAAILLEEEEFDPQKPIEERDREAEEEEELGDELLRVAALVDYGSLARASAGLSAAIDEALPALDSWSGAALERGRGKPVEHEAWGGDVLLVLETGVGTLVVGGPGTTIYRAGCALAIDLGGDDVYLEKATRPEPERSVCVVIDAGGDDLYLTGDHSIGAGFMSAGVLVDLGGSDLYSAGSFSQGSGLFGFGLLEDRGGNDTYVGDTCSQGSGAFGLGILSDAAGNDSYEAALFSQAFGFVKGLGALLDSGGNDTYVAGGKYTDEIRYFDHYLSLSQGFGFGWRPDASGGIGLLADAAGNDVYVSDIFGQGSSYWFAVGGLVDLSGNDEYVSYQYAQGAGTHITVAALVDLEGDDNYVSKGVSQGCGHDLAIGLLRDAAGDDSYTCHDLSQGAGNANGIGLILDESGDDAYAVRNPQNTNGYGNHRRDYGSIGIHIDCSGSDSYSGRGADGEWWMGSDHGIGVDSNTEQEASNE